MNQSEIWHLLDSRKPGGIETHVFQIALGLLNAGKNVRVVFLCDHGAHPLKTQLRDAKIPFAYVNGGVFSLAKMLRMNKPSIVHTHGYKAGLLGRICAKLCKIPIFTTYHAGEKNSGKLAVYDYIDRHTAWVNTYNFSVSPLIDNNIPSVTQVINNFIETTNLRPSDGQQIAFVGRLSKEKGIDHFLELAKQNPNQYFHVYGDGPLYDHSVIYAPDNVVFHGQQACMETVWSNIGLLVMPSRYEGLPLSALEAMGRNIPVLATDVGALPNLLRHHYNGWLVRKEDIKALNHHLKIWIEMSIRKRHELGLNALKTINEGYSSQVVIPQILQRYQSMAYSM